jgi:hypothetical protein
MNAVFIEVKIACIPPTTDPVAYTANKSPFGWQSAGFTLSDTS